MVGVVGSLRYSLWYIGSIFVHLLGIPFTIYIDMIKLKDILNEDMTEAQNQAIKKLYILMRDILKDVVDKAKLSGITSENLNISEFTKFFRNYKPISKVKIDKDDSSVGKPTLKVSIPKDITEILSKIRPIIDVVLSCQNTNSNAELNSLNGISFQLVIVMKKILKDFDSYKISLQHEMQHAIDKGGSPDEDEPNKLIKTIDYLLNLGELIAHAKQYAYMYYKKFPKDTELDFNKFKSNFYKKEDTKLNNYINFGEDSERLRIQYGLTDEKFKQMTDGYKTFVATLIRSFKYFTNSKVKGEINEEFEKSSDAQKQEINVRLAAQKQNLTYKDYFKYL